LILLLGSTGYVGNKFRKLLSERRLEYKILHRAECDVYSVEELTRAIAESQADFLINCAGYTGKPNVDACEFEKAECLRANAVLPGMIDLACKKAGIQWGHVSSGCIYTGDGGKPNGFTEEDKPNFSFRTNNCSFYSGTKALGEEILAESDGCYIWRLRIPFDNYDNPRNYLTKVMRYERLLQAVNSLSHLDDFVNACLDCRLNSLPFGIYNLTNTGHVTTREVVELLKPIIAAGREFRFFESESEFMSIAAKTPRSNCVLDNAKAVSAGLKLPNVHEAVLRAVKAWSKLS
jgi:dTDP-4-dehydrorhamnose reductase